MKIVADISIGSMAYGTLARWQPAALFAQGQAGACLDLTRAGALFSDTAGSVAITAGAVPVARAQDWATGSDPLLQAVSGQRPLSTRYPRCGLRTLMANSNPNAAGFVQSGGPLTNEAGFGPAPASVGVAANALTTYGYLSGILPNTVVGRISLHVAMQDGDPPIFTSSSATNAGNTLVLRANSANQTPTNYDVQDLGGGIFRVSTAVTGTGTGNCGFIRYSSNQQRAFRIAAFQLEAGGLTNWQWAQQGGLDVTESGAAAVLGLRPDLIDDTLALTLSGAVTGEVFVAGAGACHVAPLTLGSGATFTVGPQSWTQGPANALLTILGQGATILPRLLGVVLRAGSFSPAERSNLTRYFQGRGAGAFQEVL